MTAKGVGYTLRGRKIAQKEEGLMDTDNNVMIAKVEGLKGLNGNGKIP